MHLVIQWSAVGAVAAVMLAMRRLHGSVMGLVVALLVAMSPLTTGAFNKVFSGLPFLAFLFAGAWLVMPDRDGRQVGLWRGLAGAVLLAASLWMRSIGLLILPGLVLVDVFRKEGRRWQGAVLAGVVLVMWIPWVSWASSAAGEASRPSTQLGLFDYQSAMFHVDKRDPDSAFVDLDGWIARLVENVEGITETVGVILVGTAEGPLSGLATLLLAAAILFTWWRRQSLLDWYAVAYCIVMLLYFTFVDRLLLGLVPMIYSSIVYSVEALAKRWASPERALRTPVCVGLVAALLLAVGVVRAPDTMKFDMVSSHNWEQVDSVAADWVRLNTEQDAPVLYLKAPVLAALTGRLVYSYRNLPGTWPDGCPAVDWAIFTPNTSMNDRNERAVRQRAGEPKQIACDWLVADGDGYRMVKNSLRVYDLRR
jgi:4-amino-4-deoxy-L-arabinose transferase-like glycosyltransferase